MRQFGSRLLVGLPEQDAEISRGSGAGFSAKARSRGEGAAALRRADSDEALGGKTSRALARFLWIALILTFAAALGGSALAAYAPISLDVPSYKQFDSRWASVEIGNSGKTMGKIGCAVSSLAMTESYRTGNRITPDIMENRLSFTSGGSLFWPGNYALPGSMTFQQLYQRLKSGVPVIAGAIKADGGTHFVVITGYDGGDALSASGFLINDPGSSSRTRLSQFLAAYPKLYRRVHY